MEILTAWPQELWFETKQAHSEISLWLLLPYHPTEQKAEVPEGFDGSFYPEGMEKVPRRLAIVKSNRYMVEHVEYLIVYARYPASNTQKLLKYAQRKTFKRITML